MPEASGDEHPDGVDRALAADDQKRLAFEAADDRCDDGVDGDAKRQQYGQRSHIFHSLTPF